MNQPPALASECHGQGEVEENRMENKFSWACATFLVKDSKLKKSNIPERWRRFKQLALLRQIVPRDLAETSIRKNYAVSLVRVTQWI